MAIQKQPVAINFAMGMDQKTDPWQIKVGKFLSLKNRVFNKGGRLEKRNGYSALGTSVATPALPYANSQIPGTLAAGRNLATYSNELVLNDGLNLYSYATTSNNWVYKGRAELCSAAVTSVYKNQYNNLMQDSALNSTLGINIYAWESWTADPNKNGTLTGVQISAVDATNGQTIFNSYLSSTTSRPKCVSISNKLYVIYYDSADSSLHAQPITQAGFGSASALIANIDTTNTNYDVQVINGNIYVAYNGTGSTVKAALFSSTLSAGATVSKAETATNGIGIFTDASFNVWIAYNNGSATKAFVMDGALVTTVLAPTVVDNAAGSAVGVLNVTGIHDGTRAVIFYDKPSVPLAGQATGYTVSASFVQPAVGSTVSPTVSGGGGSYNDFHENNSIVYIPTGGYYFIKDAFDGAIPSVKNLGYTGNAAPGATVAATAQNIYPTAGYQKSIITYNTLTLAGTAGTAATFLRSVALASKAFLVNGVAHVVTTHDSPLQPTYFLCSLYNTVNPVPNAAVVAKLAESSGGGIPYRSLLPQVNTVSTGVFNVALLTRTFEILQTSSNASNAIYFLGVFSSQVDFTTNDIQTSDLGSNLQIGSGTLLVYDGLFTVEQGFHLYPETITGVAAGDDGGLAAGTYGYKIVYEWIDNQGQAHRSSPSINLSVTAAGLNHVTLTIPTLRATEKQGATIAIYRTLVNGSGPYYRIDTQGGTQFPVSNSVSSDSVTFVDYYDDANISGNEQLYTGEEVENIAAPATNVMAEYKNRLVVIPSDNPYTWWFSKQVVSGSPVEFSDLFQQNAGTVGGGLKGAAKLDDKLILFKASSVYYVTGTGPSPSGANNDFADPQFVTSDAGLQDARSIVTTPVGLMFKSAKGIYLLDRSLQARYIGAAVEDYNAYTVRGAQLIPTQNQVRFSLSNGTALVYDYYWTDESGIGQWAIFDNVSAVSSIIFNSLHTYVTSAGQVYKESVGTYMDGAVGVNTYFKTGWVNVAGLQGFERAYFFYFLAKYISAHTLTINIYYDYDDVNVGQTLVITPNSADLEQWRVFLTKQKCEAFLLEVQEGGSSGAGYTMSGLDLLVGLKGGYPRLKAAASAS